MNIFKKTSIAIVICLMAAPVNSQVDLVQCHKECIIHGMTADHGRHREYHSLNVLQICQNDQEFIFAIKACLESCRDIAQIKYGGRNAGSRLSSYKALNKMINRASKPLQLYGLWDGTKTPTIADNDTTKWIVACAGYIEHLEELDFDIGCERHVDNDYYCPNIRP